MRGNICVCVWGGGESLENTGQKVQWNLTLIASMAYST